MVTLLKNLKPGMKARGSYHECLECKARFIGRADALYCSDRCRKRRQRRIPKEKKDA